MTERTEMGCDVQVEWTNDRGEVTARTFRPAAVGSGANGQSAGLTSSGGRHMADGTQRIYVPGEMEWERRRRAIASGIPLPSDVVDSLRGLAEDLKLSEPLAQLFA